MRIIRNVMVPMRDGVKLATSVYLPKEPGKYPVALVRTAYNRVGGLHHGLAHRGIATVTQDVRGRYASEGEFYPFLAETNDGLDTLDWIAKQPWCDGHIGMFGDSYLGLVQFAIAHANHPNLTAFNPRFMMGDSWKHAYYNNGVFSIALSWSWLCMEVGSRTAEAAQLPLYNLRELLMELPLIDLDEKSGGRSQHYRDYVTHYAKDEFWRPIDYRARLPECKRPMLLHAGWYDYYPGETFLNYNALLAGDAPESVNRQHRVIVGPYTHGFSASTRLGAIDFGPHSMKENDSTVHWLATMLKGGDARDFQPAPIRIFVMGANIWRDEHEWPLKRTQWTKYFLHSGGRANSLLGDGTLSPAAPAASEKPDRYTYDPMDPTPTTGGNHSVGPYNPGLYEICLPGPQDQNSVERRDDVLVYTSDVLDADTEVTGPVVVKLFASSDCSDTDFVARLCDVHPNGLSINLCEGVIRARFRELKWDKPKLMKPGEVYEFKIELEPTSNVFFKGHRIRVQITSSNFPLWDRNPNTGGDPPTETRVRRAEQTIFHDAAHPSHVVLPIVPSGSLSPSRGEG